MAEDKGKEEEKFDFTSEGEGYISLDEARVLAMRTAVASPGNYGSAYRGVDMVFDFVESIETDDYYMVTLSVRPQGNVDGTPGQEQFVIGKDGTIAVRQVLASPIGKGSAFPVLPVAIGVVIVGIIAAVGAVVVLMGPGGERVPVAAVSPTETPAPTQPPVPTETLAPTETPAPDPTFTPMPTYTPYPTPTFTPMPTYTPYPTPTPRPTYTPRPIPTARVIVVTPTPIPRPRPTSTPNASSYYNKGEEYWAAENWVMAIGEYTKAIQVNPDLEDAYYYRAISYEMLDQYQNAFNDYNKAVLLDPDDAYNYNGRGNAYSNLGQTANANANKTRACSLDSQWC
jgi:hypothetical protein